MQTILVLAGLVCGSQAWQTQDQESLANFLLAFNSPSATQAPATLTRAPPRMVLKERIEAMVPVYNFEGTKTGEKSMALKVAESGPYLLKQKAVMEAANKRQGNAQAKVRGEVRGGGAKPYAQKGSGRARRGSSRSPLIVGGGKSHGPRATPGKWDLKMPKKMKKVAMSTAFMNAAPRTVIVPELESNFKAPKTKDMVNFLKRVGVGAKDKVYLLTKTKDENTFRSGKNIPTLVHDWTDGSYSIRDLMNAEKLVMSEEAYNAISEKYAFDAKL